VEPIETLICLTIWTIAVYVIVAGWWIGL